MYGEITADGLVDEVTANWGTFIENGAGYQQLTETGRDWFRTRLMRQRESEGGGGAEQLMKIFRQDRETAATST